jgi:hypothetical protein
LIEYDVERILAKETKKYICEHHYSHGCHNGPSPCYGLFDNGTLIGVCAFAVPCSERVRSSVFGPDYKGHVTELHRLHILDCTPKNTESWFIAKCLKLLKKDKPEIWAVISFSDLTVGHTGIIYKASNAYRLGTTERKRFYIDKTGRIRHPRQCGQNITAAEAKERGWRAEKRDSKNRFLWLLPDGKRHKKYLIQLSKYELRTGGGER